MPFTSIFSKSRLPKPTITDPKLDRLWERINEAFRWHEKGSRRWSLAYHLAFGVATLAGAIVTFLSGQKDEEFLGMSNGTAIGVLAMTATLLTSIGGFGGFERKWHANRIARSRLWELLTKIESTQVDPAQICAELAKIIEEEDAGIMGGKATPPPPAEPPDHH